MKMTLRKFGFDVMQRKFEAMKNIPQTVINNPLLAAGFQTEAFAKSLCPVDTGRLRSSIHVEVISPTKIFVGTDVYYAWFVEFGTSNQSPQPYMRPAIEVTKLTLGNNIVASFVAQWEAA